MDQFVFIRIIFVAALVAIGIMCLVFPLSARVGLRAAALALRTGLWGFAAVSAGALGLAVASGEWQRFSAGPGLGGLVEVVGFFGAFMFVVYFMGSRHIATVVRHARESDAEAHAEKGAG